MTIRLKLLHTSPGDQAYVIDLPKYNSLEEYLNNMSATNQTFIQVTKDKAISIASISHIEVL